MYKAHMGWGGCHNYNEKIYLLYIMTNELGKISNWRLRSETTDVAGDDMETMLVYLSRLPKTTLVFVDDLRKVRAFLYERITKDHTVAIDYDSNIEFRSWSPFAEENEFNVMMKWQQSFVEGKFPYLTPSRCSRKAIADGRNGSAKELWPKNVTDLKTIGLAVHPGVLYCRDTEIAYNMLGFDISSAYIYSLVFCKHASSAPTESNPADWELYINAEDSGTIGYYTIEYNCVFSIIRCFKDVYGQPLKTGHHTAKIMLSNIDLRLLMQIPQFRIESISCSVLYVFSMDYLPIEIRKYCIELYLRKQSLPKHSIDRDRIKVELNSIFGNMLYDMNKILESDDPKHALRIRARNASVCPQWGIYTMAYTKQAVIGLGIKAVGYRYSDTDSIYCADDSYNRKLFDEYNNNLVSHNYEIATMFNYEQYGDIDTICHLGLFDVDAEIARFRAWGYKTYAYETQPTKDENGEIVPGELVVKASGVSQKYCSTDADIVFSKDYKPKPGAMTRISYGKDWYTTTKDHAWMFECMT